jgi:Dolichyl-phosphate-mannose-protein mannosyltransferase
MMLSAVAAAVLLIYSFLPLASALEFGDDEGFEVIKPFLCMKGFSLYKEIWSDQPPLLTVVLTWAFRMWGPTIVTARMVAAGFGVALFVVFFELVRQRSGLWAAVLAGLLLLGSPVVLQLSVSVMLETPAFVMALLSALLLFQWCKHRHTGWLLASGAAMGLALQIKLTACLVGPAMLAEITLAQWFSGKPRWLRATVQGIAQWSVSFMLVFLAIGIVWARGSLQSSFRSHFAERPTAGWGRAEEHVLPGGLLLRHADGLGAAAIALVLLAARKRWREGAFPAVLLLTVSAIHAVHRPWWTYYYLHFALPLAWLGGLALREMISAASGWLAPPLGLTYARTWKGLALLGLAALLLARPERRLEANIKDLRHRPTVASSRLVATIRQYAGRTHWVYADKVIYAFHAQVLVPPELAVIMFKRFWSGQITTEGIVAACKHYHAEQLVFTDAPAPEWSELLASQYVLACTENDSTLYVAKSIYDPVRTSLEGDGLHGARPAVSN